MVRFIISVDYHAPSKSEFVRRADALDTPDAVARDLLGGQFFDFRRAFEFDTVTGATRDVTSEIVKLAVRIGHDEMWDAFRDVPVWFVRNGHVGEEDFPEVSYGDPNAEHRLTASDYGVGRFA